MLSALGFLGVMWLAFIGAHWRNKSMVLEGQTALLKAEIEAKNREIEELNGKVSRLIESATKQYSLRY